MLVAGEEKEEDRATDILVSVTSQITPLMILLRFWFGTSPGGDGDDEAVVIVDVEEDVYRISTSSPVVIEWEGNNDDDDDVVW